MYWLIGADVCSCNWEPPVRIGGGDWFRLLLLGRSAVLTVRYGDWKASLRRHINFGTILLRLLGLLQSRWRRHVRSEAFADFGIEVGHYRF